MASRLKTANDLNDHFKPICTVGGKNNTELTENIGVKFILKYRSLKWKKMSK